MERYWRINRSDEDIIEFLDFLKTEHGYLEHKRSEIFPSRISYGIGMKPKETIIVTVDGGVFTGNIINTLSEGHFGEKRVKITWEEDAERRIINFDLKYVRKAKLEKIEKIIEKRK